MRVWMRGMIAVLLAVLLLPVAFAQTGLSIDVTSLQPEGRSITMAFRVTDQTVKRDVLDLDKNDLVVMQDGVELKNPQLVLTSHTTDAANNTIAFGQGELSTNGATIALVVDLSTLLNRQGDPTDYNTQAKQVAIQWLEAGRNTAPGDPEKIALFVPATSGNEPLQPDTLQTFTQDRNLVIGALREMAPRNGATFLYDAILAAANATAREAQAHGTQAYVVVISDGGTNPASPELLSAINAATDNGNAVQLIGFGVGAPGSLTKTGANLKRLADSSGGVYRQSPSDAQVTSVYESSVKTVNRGWYEATFTTDLVPDNQDHTVQIRVNQNGQIGESAVLPWRWDGGPGTTLQPINDILMYYLLRAGPLAIIIAVITAIIASATRRRPGDAAAGTAVR